MRWSLDLEVKVWTCSNCPLLWMRLQTSSKLLPSSDLSLHCHILRLNLVDCMRIVRFEPISFAIAFCIFTLISCHRINSHISQGQVQCMCVCVRHKPLEKCGSTGVTADIWVLLQKKFYLFEKDGLCLLFPAAFACLDGWWDLCSKKLLFWNVGQEQDAERNHSVKRMRSRSKGKIKVYL